MYILTTVRFKILDRTETTEMGLESPSPIGVLILSTERMRATRHCSGIVVELNDRLKRQAIQPEHIGSEDLYGRKRPDILAFTETLVIITTIIIIIRQRHVLHFPVFHFSHTTSLHVKWFRGMSQVFACVSKNMLPSL